MAVMNRILKDKATVPLFFAQTLIQSLRDVGYNHTTSALCEHVDNAIQAGATEVRIFFHQTGKRGNYNTDIAVYDNGSGMSPNVAKVAMAFGGSMNFDNREGIARFGMGMKTAALSMSPVFDLYTWQEPAAFYNMMLDVEEIGKDRANLVQLPDPTLQSELPDEVFVAFDALPRESRGAASPCDYQHGGGLPHGLPHRRPAVLLVKSTERLRPPASPAAAREPRSATLPPRRREQR
jgi:hypothetical protein